MFKFYGIRNLISLIYIVEIPESSTFVLIFFNKNRFGKNIPCLKYCLKNFILIETNIKFHYLKKNRNLNIENVKPHNYSRRSGLRPPHTPHKIPSIRILVWRSPSTVWNVLLKMFPLFHSIFLHYLKYKTALSCDKNVHFF